MIDKKYKNIFPKNLSLSRNGSKISYKAAKSQIDLGFIELLKKNKDLIIRLMLQNDYNHFELFPLCLNQKALWFINQIKKNLALLLI